MITSPPQIEPPVHLEATHSLEKFDCGNAEMNNWLRRRALRNEEGASRTYVVTPANSTDVIAFYTLAMGTIMHEHALGKVKRNMPDPIPAMLLGRLAVDKAWQGKGIGDGMLKAAILKSLAISNEVGVQALFVHALDETAAGFYRRHGFYASPVNPLTMMITMKEARLALR